jgi:hypothetical protein
MSSAELFGFEQGSKSYPKNTGQFRESEQANVKFAAFEPADVRTIHVGGVSQGFLRQPFSTSNRPHTRADPS